MSIMGKKMNLLVPHIEALGSGWSALDRTGAISKPLARLVLGLQSPPSQPGARKWGLSSLRSTGMTQVVIWQMAGGQEKLMYGYFSCKEDKPWKEKIPRPCSLSLKQPLELPSCSPSIILVDPELRQPRQREQSRDPSEGVKL